MDVSADSHRHLMGCFCDPSCHLRTVTERVLNLSTAPWLGFSAPGPRRPSSSCQSIVTGETNNPRQRNRKCVGVSVVTGTCGVSGQVLGLLIAQRWHRVLQVIYS